MNETFIPASDYNRKKWYVIDCQGKQLGRISSMIVGLLSGKIKSYYHPAFDTGDYVILINAESLTVDRNFERIRVFSPGRPGSSLKRITKRNRPGETITLNYLEKCHKAHNEWLGKELITLYLNGEREGETSLPDDWDLCIQTFIKTNTPDESYIFNLLDHPFF